MAFRALISELECPQNLYIYLFHAQTVTAVKIVGPMLANCRAHHWPVVRIVCFSVLLANEPYSNRTQQQPNRQLLRYSYNSIGSGETILNCPIIAPNYRVLCWLIIGYPQYLFPTVSETAKDERIICATWNRQKLPKKLSALIQNIPKCTNRWKTGSRKFSQN